jgi:cell division septation protein DedD
MSFEIPQQAKYRLTGGLILVSLAIFVLPGLMQKSNQRFEESIAKHSAVPPKPKAPRLSIPSRKQAFEELRPLIPIQEPKIAEPVVDIQLSKAEPLEWRQTPVQAKEAAHSAKAVKSPEIKPRAQVAALSASIEAVKAPEKIVQLKPKAQVLALPAVEKALKGNYAVQLASFSHPENADFLVKRLGKMGYPAQIFKIPAQKGILYQVVVGRIDNKQNAIALQKKLAQNLQLQGLIINKEMG